MNKEYEPLLKQQENRFVLFPIKYNDIWQQYLHQVECFWTPDELDLQQDLKDWNKLDNNEQHFIKYILAFFAASDGIVIENLVEDFMANIQIPECKSFYGFQIMMENIHQHTYSLLIDTYISKDDEKAKLFNAMNEIQCIKNKANWALKWIKNGTFQERLIAFAIVEGIFFSGSFCSIFWLKKRSLMPGLSFSNELISRDEGLHQNFACLLYNNYIVNKLDDQTVYNMVKEAVLIEQEFITEAISCDLIGMSSKDMKQYIEFVSDKLLIQLQLKPIFKSQNPFDWMDMISMQNQTNFFENRVSEYKKAKIKSQKTGHDEKNQKNQLDLNLDDDF